MASCKGVGDVRGPGWFEDTRIHDSTCSTTGQGCYVTRVSRGVLDVDGVETCRGHWESLSDQYRYADPTIMLDKLLVKGA